MNEIVAEDEVAEIKVDTEVGHHGHNGLGVGAVLKGVNDLVDAHIAGGAEERAAWPAIFWLTPEGFPY